MRVAPFLLFTVFSAAAAIAQTPLVRLVNLTRPASPVLQIGDRFEVVITGAARQPVSVRTTMHGRTDWGPVIGWTDTAGNWTVAGQFEKEDYGDWSEFWTVGGQLASPALRFTVEADCPHEAKNFLLVHGAGRFQTCEASSGTKTFSTPSEDQPFRTPDGRTIPGRAKGDRTPRQYHQEIMGYLITSNHTPGAAGEWGDQAGAMITELVGVNALSADEIRNVLGIVRAAYEHPGRVPPSAQTPIATLALLQKLSTFTSDKTLQAQIDDATAHLQSR